MKTYEIEYTTNLNDRLTVTMSGNDKTDAYLNFVYAFPKDYIITEMREI